jgi:hypothetical protein
MFKLITKILLLAVAVLVAGCATSRSEIKLASPVTTQASYPVTKSTVVLIRSVTDERVFEEAPSVASIPSEETLDTRARAVGRKRNTVGKAMGVVLLENGQTVSSVVRDNLLTALNRAGYRTTTNPTEAGASPLIMDVHIKQFWAWFQPGFWAIRLNANIETSLVTNRDALETAVSVHAENSRQFATDDAWAEIIDTALKDYRTQVTKKFAHLP